MSDFIVSLEQPKDSFANGAYVNTIPFGEDVFLPLAVVDCTGWDRDESTVKSLVGAASCEFLNADAGYHSSWLTLHELEDVPDGQPSIELIVKGDAYGHAGSVAPRHTEAVRAVARMCNCEVADLHATVCHKTFDSMTGVPILIYGYLVMKSDEVDATGTAR